MSAKESTIMSGPVESELKREQRALLIQTLSRFKPDDANPQQFYNCVRELCIIHNCSIDEGLERAALTWPGLSQRQREIYDSERHAELPIPVPQHLLYHALQKERIGLWSLGRSSKEGNQSTRYTIEAYKPAPKPSRWKKQEVKYDNLLDLSPKMAAMRVAPPPNPKHSRISPASGRRIRSLNPNVRTISQIRTKTSGEEIKDIQERNHTNQGKKQLYNLEFSKVLASSSSSGDKRNQKK